MGQKKANYMFYQNTDCEYYPCHSMEHLADFNCKFCFCPLYPLGTECGGHYIFHENGTKDCSACLIPHQKNGYDYVISKLKSIK